MADQPRHADSNADTSNDTGVESNRAASTGIIRWQKVVGIIGLLVILWVGNQMVGQLTGRGLGPGGLGPGPGQGGFDHSPGQNAPPAEIQDQETDTEDGGHTPPAGP